MDVFDILSLVMSATAIVIALFKDKQFFFFHTNKIKYEICKTAPQIYTKSLVNRDNKIKPEIISGSALYEIIIDVKHQKDENETIGIRRINEITAEDLLTMENKQFYSIKNNTTCGIELQYFTIVWGQKVNECFLDTYPWGTLDSGERVGIVIDSYKRPSEIVIKFQGSILTYDLHSTNNGFINISKIEVMKQLSKKTKRRQDYEYK